MYYVIAAGLLEYSSMYRSECESLSPVSNICTINSVSSYSLIAEQSQERFILDHDLKETCQVAQSSKYTE